VISREQGTPESTKYVQHHYEFEEFEVTPTLVCPEHLDRIDGFSLLPPYEDVDAVIQHTSVDSVIAPPSQRETTILRSSGDRE
jgi:hypothetical protein